MPARAHLLLLLVSFSALAAVVVDEAQAQNGFRITYEVDRSRPERARLTGRVINESVINRTAIVTVACATSRDVNGSPPAS